MPEGQKLALAAVVVLLPMHAVLRCEIVGQVKQGRGNLPLQLC